MLRLDTAKAAGMHGLGLSLMTSGGRKPGRYELQREFLLKSPYLSNPHTICMDA